MKPSTDRKTIVPVARIAAAGLVYGAPVLAAAWLLADVRNFFLIAGADPLLTALGAAPALALVMVYAAGWAVRLFGVAPALGQRLAMGALAAGLLALATIIGQGLPSAWHWAEVGAQLATGPGLVFMFSLALVIVLPTVRARVVDPA